MPNFSSLAGLEVPEKFGVGWCGWVGGVGSKWVLCLTQRSCFWVALVELSWVELCWVLTISGGSISGTYYLSTMTDMKYTDTLSSSGHVTPDYLGWHQVRLLIHTSHSSHVSTSCTCHVSLTSCFVSPSSCHVSSCHVIISCVIVVMCHCLHVKGQ